MRKLDYEDYARLPDDGKRYEVLDGELYVTASPSLLHQRLSKRLQRRLEDYFEVRGLGEVFNAPTDLILAQHDIVVPDLVIVAEPGQLSARAIEGVPLVVVEILSPSTRGRDRGIKMRRYAALGVPHYWIVDPDAQTIECWLESGEYPRHTSVRAGRAPPPRLAGSRHRPRGALAPRRPRLTKLAADASRQRRRLQL